MNGPYDFMFDFDGDGNLDSFEKAMSFDYLDSLNSDNDLFGDEDEDLFGENPFGEEDEDLFEEDLFGEEDDDFIGEESDDLFGDDLFGDDGEDEWE